jgi:phage I-like protein
MARAQRFKTGDNMQEINVYGIEIRLTDDGKSLKGMHQVRLVRDLDENGNQIPGRARELPAEPVDIIKNDTLRKLFAGIDDAIISGYNIAIAENNILKGKLAEANEAVTKTKELEDKIGALNTLVKNTKLQITQNEALTVALRAENLTLRETLNRMRVKMNLPEI